MERLSKAEKKSEALKKINEVDLLTFGPGTLAARGQWLGGKYTVDGFADRIINFYYLIELNGESRRALARKRTKEAISS